MSAGIAAADVDRFRDIVSRSIGLETDESNLGHLAEVLAERITALRSDPARYLRLIASPAGADELGRIATRISVGETYFFRGSDQFRAFAEAAIPELMAARSSSRRLRILSAGCASGEEAYTVAILLQRFPELRAWDVRISGIDVNPAAIERARAGRYTSWSLRETPPEVAAEHFTGAGNDRILDAGVRSAALFECRNLIGEDDGFWAAGSFDAIFCRNVTIYFASETTRRLIARFARALAPGGFLFLGHAETLRGISQDFHLRATHGAFYYQVKDGAERSAIGRSDAAGQRDATSAPPPALSANWFDDIGRSSERVATLTERAVPAPPAAPDEASSVEQLRSLFREERFGALADRLRDLGADAAEHPAIALLHAAMLANRGETAQAERLCAVVLARDELNADAHYIAALCRESSGDLAAAADHARSAAHLDPRFAMPRLKLALLARRAGDSAQARIQGRAAIELLHHEDELRILLLAGGFTRETLLELCRSELRALGDAS